MRRIETRLTPAQCNEIGARIIEWFYTEPGGDGGRQYGCDWPTMRMLHPAKCQVFARLKAQYKLNIDRDAVVLLGYQHGAGPRVHKKGG